MPRLIRVTLAPEPPPRLDKALARDIDPAEEVSRSRLARLLADGAVSLAGMPVTDAKRRPAAGETYEIAVEDAVDPATAAEPIPLRILHEDDELVVVDKPAGLVVHPAPGSPAGTLVNALLHHFGGALSGVGGEKRPGIVHRIDKDTSGLLVAAKTDRAHHALARQFARHSAHRLYLALCHGLPEPGDPRLAGLRGIGFEPGGTIRIATGLARHKTDRQRQAVLFEGGRHAVTRLRVREGFAGQAALVDCRLETGRTHQIRVHMAYAGFPLLGDPTYGGRRRVKPGLPWAAAANAFPRQALHAAELGFDHPATGERLTFESPLPEDMAALLAAMRGQ